MSFRSNSNIGSQLNQNQQLFGAGFTQNANSIIFSKNDLFGLTPTPNNTAESLLVGIIKRLLLKLNERGKAEISYWGSSIDNNVRIDVIVLDFFKEVTYSNTYEIDDLPFPFDPDLY